MLARTEPVSKLAERHRVSRKFLYDQADKGEQALEQVFKSTSPSDEQVLFYLPVTRAWLRQAVLGLVLLCHSSFRGVMAFFADLLDQPIAPWVRCTISSKKPCLRPAGSTLVMTCPGCGQAAMMSCSKAESRCWRASSWIRCIATYWWAKRSAMPRRGRFICGIWASRV